MSAVLKVPGRDDSERPLIELIGICKTYSTGEVLVEALRGVSLKLYAGEFVAIMGASGSGKSTLMNVLGCLDRPTAGEYRFAGNDVSTFDRDELARLRREAFGFVFQSYNLIGTSTATENVEIPATYAGVAPRDRRTRAEKLLSTLGLEARLGHRPNQLSGGQQQRVSIARALMNGGQVILADEPTGALDSRSGAEVMGLLRDLARRGHTVVLITHDREVAAHAERIIEIKDGEIVSDSGPSAADDRKAAGPAASQDNVIAAPWIAASSQNKGHVASPLTDGIEALVMALRSLKANLFRTVLTLLGIVIGVGSVIAMLAVGEGAKQQVVDRIGRMGSNLLVVRAGAPSQRGPGAGTANLVLADVEALKAVPNVLAAVPETNGTVTVRYGNRDVQTQVTATSTEYPLTRDWPVAKGIFFSDEDQRSYAAVTVLGQTVVNNLFPGDEPIGRYVLFNNVPFLVIGVMSSKGATQFGQDSDDVVFVPVTTGGLRLFGQTFLRSVTVAVEDLALIDTTQSQVSELLISRHGREDFQLRNMVALIETVSATQNTLTVLLGSIAAISLLVGGIGVMNIMLVSVTERTREIGIRMATGARTRDILRQFLTEATVVCAIGGVIGVSLGIATGLALTRLDMPVKFTATPILLAFCCAVATGVVFGFAPALKAARLDPVVALSSE